VLTDMARIRPRMMLALLALLVCAEQSLPASVDNTGMIHRVVLLLVLVRRL